MAQHFCASIRSTRRETGACTASVEIEAPLTPPGIDRPTPSPRSLPPSPVSTNPSWWRPAGYRHLGGAAGSGEEAQDEDARRAARPRRAADRQGEVKRSKGNSRTGLQGEASANRTGIITCYSNILLPVDFKGPLTKILTMAVTNGVVHASYREPLFSFGVIADVQYADIPDGRSFLGIPRYYRHSISVLQRAVSRWNKQHNIKFSINFGDIIDGFCPKDKSLWAVQKVLDEFEKFGGPTYHMFGNHCLYNLPRSKLVSLLKMPTNSDRAYYDFSACPQYKFVVLDAYDFSALGWPRDHPVTAEAMKFLDEKNPNSDKNSPDSLVGVDRRFVMFNGAIGKEQLSWLNDVLQDASLRRQNVIICSHLPMDPGATSPEALMWNYDEVMAIVRQYNCVKACFAGHDHKGGHSVDSHGVHHRTLEAALECPPGTSAFGHIEAYPDRLLLVGSDRMADTEICFESSCAAE